MKSPAETSAWWHTWAAAELKVPPESPCERVRAAFLARLAKEDFAPGASVRHAFQLLTAESETAHTVQHALRQISHVREEMLGKAVEEFAEHFWELAPVERGHRWQELRAACAAIPRARARLEELQPALGLEAPSVAGGNEAIAQLVEHLQALSVCRPLEWVALRNSLIERVQGDPEWRRAVQTVHAQLPELAELHSEFLKKIAAPRRPQTGRPRIKIPAAPAATSSSSGRDGSSPFRFWWVLVLVAGSLMRLMSQGCRSEPTSPNQIRISDDVQRILDEHKHRPKKSP